MHQPAASACENIGTWPVVAGSHPRRWKTLSSAIILYDYTRIAPESPGNPFDSTDIDEMGLSEPVAAAVDTATTTVEDLVYELLERKVLS